MARITRRSLEQTVLQCAIAAAAESAESVNDASAHTDGLPSENTLMKRYVGTRDADSARVTVLVDGAPQYALPPRLDIRNHSPSGFNWGYHGSGPAQLALAILADYLSTNIPEYLSAVLTVEESADLDWRRLSYADRIAEALHQQFKRTMIARIESDNWRLTEDDIAGALQLILSKREA